MRFLPCVAFEHCSRASRANKEQRSWHGCVGIGSSGSGSRRAVVMRPAWYSPAPRGRGRRGVSAGAGACLCHLCAASRQDRHDRCRLDRRMHDGGQNRSGATRSPAGAAGRTSHDGRPSSRRTSPVARTAARAVVVRARGPFWEAQIVRLKGLVRRELEALAQAVDHHPLWRVCNALVIRPPRNVWRRRAR